MNFTLVSAAMPFAIVEWLAVGYGWRKVEYVAKPGVMFFETYGLFF